MIEESKKTYTVKVMMPDGQELVASNMTKENAEWLESKLLSNNPLQRQSDITDAECQQAWLKCKSIASHMYHDAVRWTEAHYGIKNGN